MKKLTPFHLFLLLPMPLLAASAHPVDESNVVWESPSTNAAGSMPIGNGDLGLNVWVEEDGDLRFYIAKTDAWDQNGALLKLGGIRVSLSPNPFAKGLPFRQELRLRDGEIRIQAGEVGRAATLRVWVDANQPVIRVEAETEQPSKLTVRLENWRTEKRLQAGEALWYYSWHVGGADGACLKKPTPVEVWLTADSVLDEGSQRVVWYHRNEESNWGYAFRQQGMADVMGRFKDPLLKRTFGAAIACKGLKRVDKLTLASAAPQKHHAVSLHPLTAQTESAREWLAQLDRQIARTERTDIGQARGKHQQWWREFWDRSFIRVTRAPLSGSGKMTTAVSSPLRIGADPVGGNLFKGFIQRVRVFTRALSPAEIAALAAAPDVSAPAGAVADWKLGQLDDGAVTNSAQAGMTAKVSGSLTVTEHAGRPALRFGGDGFLEVANDSALDLAQAGTLEAWVATDALSPEGARIVDKGVPGTANGYVLDTYPGNSLRLISQAGLLTCPGPLAEGKWSHVAATFGQGVRRLFIDGREVAADGQTTAEDGAQRALTITRAYALQRWVGACAGRGAFPIKFNGSLFTVDTKFVNGSSYGPDGRLWGGDYWWQNTRLPYWPMLASGDFELMRPLFEMYFNRLPVERARTKAWFGCEGAFMAETASFWGMMSVGDYGYQRPASLAKGETENGVMRYYWQPGLELTHMMLDYYEYTGDRTFFRERLAPMAEQYLLFYQTRFGSDAGGKLRITPAQSLETWANVVNPAPDVVALRQNVSRLLALPEGLLPESLTKVCRDLRPALPEVALKQADGVTVIGFAGEIHCQRSNVENPELYPVYPYRNFGLGRPGLDIARATFERRMNKETWGWQQSGMQAACLGLADEAALILAANVKMGNPAFRFPVMWGPNYDWLPDQCHGGNILNTLQHMLLQADGRKIYVLPAWPKEWDVEFKLHAPFNTTVECAYRDANVISLKVTPETRAADVVLSLSAKDHKRLKTFIK